MNYVGIEAIKNAYSQDKIKNNNYKRGLEIANKTFTEPVYEGFAVHPEVEPLRSEINNAFQDMSIDFAALEKEISHCAVEYKNLLSTLNLRLDAVDQQIQVEKDRIKDINAICGLYPQFSAVIPITGGTVKGTFGWNNNAFSGAPLEEYQYCQLNIDNISGNGINGNDFVKDAIKSQDSYIADNDHLTSWEYSRYTAAHEVSGSPVPVNLDTEEAKATISLSSDYFFKNLRIQSDKDIIIEDILVSPDSGLTYQSCLSEEIHLNNPDIKYSDPDYIYESNLIAFPNTQYIKLCLKSNGITDDVIVNDFGDIVEGVKRHCISVNNIEAGITDYSDGNFDTGELISSPVDCIAIFANEYIPSHFQDKTYIEYYLTVNGKEYEVTPINSHCSGIKMIRFSDYTVNDSYVEHLKETIKSASLKIIIHTTQDGETPYLNNLKICLGRTV